MWTNQKVMRGLTLITVALFFGIQASRLQLGTLARAGAGLFPLIISAAVGVIGLVMLVQARFEAAEPMRFNVRNIAIIMASLIGFVLIAQHLNVLAAIVYLVFVSGLAGAEYSFARNVKISIVLIGMAAGFHFLLGLNLPLL
ncbi:MAG: tripartite tricarboxylate transporter TctB family protein [Leptothrix sp. (in: b-proteobacteria)]